eukprot:TRINITY_DN12049_c0_g1_i1.p1 TRINITY_DN12049_c0_g1~~TRINITY_DN12049_c0_g1_i1.p1  ORF type:complete len:298 (+),score=91.21 TRINITY_DN12049_c0_g1_i1:24-917(+)
MSNRVTQVTISGKALLRMLNHIFEGPSSFEKGSDVISGVLFGIEKLGEVEITEAFPDRIWKNETNQQKLVSYLIAHKFDHAFVGTYESSTHGINLQLNLQIFENTDRNVQLVFDESQAFLGNVPFRAFTITPQFMAKLYQILVDNANIGIASSLSTIQDSLDVETIKRLNLQTDEMFEEIPVKVTNAGVVRAFLLGLYQDKTKILKNDERVGFGHSIENNLQRLKYWIDNLLTENKQFTWTLDQLSKTSGSKITKQPNRWSSMICVANSLHQTSQLANTNTSPDDLNKFLNELSTKE